MCVAFQSYKNNHKKSFCFHNVYLMPRFNWIKKTFLSTGRLAYLPKHQTKSQKQRQHKYGQLQKRQQLLEESVEDRQLLYETSSSSEKQATGPGL